MVSSSEVHPDARVRIAYQGEPGAFSEAALAKLAPAAEAVPCRTFAALFAAIGEGRSDLLLAPVENTLLGPIVAVQEFLADRRLFVLDEVTLRIEHHLIGCPGANLEDIRVAQSHAAALAQCKRFFRFHPTIAAREAEDTAGSVRQVIEKGDRAIAAIAGERAATLYGGNILLRNVEDDANNYTRFVLLSDRDPASKEWLRRGSGN